LDLARSALGKQTSNGNLLNLPATHLIVPRSLEGTARTIVNSQYPNGELRVIASSYLDLVSSTAWYLVSGLNPPLTVATLKGHPTPMVSLQRNFASDDIQFRVVFDFAVIGSEFRSIVKSTGT